MKPILFFILITTSALALDPNAPTWRAQFTKPLVVSNYGAGDRPDVTESELTPVIELGVRNRLKDPGSAEFVTWTMPTLETTPFAGTRLGFWQMYITVRAKNSYGALVVQKHLVTIKQGRVDQVR